MAMTMSMTMEHPQLDAAQRARLLKSTRKLGAVLGTTPSLVCNTSSSSSRPSTPATQPTFTAQSALASPNKPLYCVTLPPPSPLHRSFSTHNNNNNNNKNHESTLSPSESELAVRRKRMAKLARTLGENIPPELVTATSRSRSRSVCLSVHVLEPGYMYEGPFATADPVPAVPSIAAATTTAAVAAAEADKAKTHSRKASTVTTASSTRQRKDSAAPFSSIIASPHAHAHGKLHTPVRIRPSMDSRRSDDTAVSYTDSNGEEIYRAANRSHVSVSVSVTTTAAESDDSMRGDHHQHPHPHPHSHHHHHQQQQHYALGEGGDDDSLMLEPPSVAGRKEREWSGHWNLKDMNAVVSGLRGLKTKC